MAFISVEKMSESMSRGWRLLSRARAPPARAHWTIIEYSYSNIIKVIHGTMDITYAEIAHVHWALMNPIISYCIANHAGLQTLTSRQHPAQYPSTTDVLHLYNSHRLSKRHSWVQCSSIALDHEWSSTYQRKPPLKPYFKPASDH
jgi:hypothetical protein